MLTIDYGYFCSNPDFLFKEIIKRKDEGLIEINGLGCFRVRYEPIEAANEEFMDAEK